MSDRMTQISFEGLMDWIFSEKQKKGTIFGVEKFFCADKEKTLSLFGGKLETPFGPAAGPHTQLAQNIVAAYVGGARFFELKTVQMLDGADITVAKPCIKAEDECYNVEWSTELTVQQAMEEYCKGWFICKLLAKEYGLGRDDGFLFNMSVGYDYVGVTSPKIDGFIEGLRDARETRIWQECVGAAIGMLKRFVHVDEAYIRAISPNVCNSITLSTLHGCPAGEIERIAAHLINEKRLHTYIKCNPTLIGYEEARGILDELGFSDVSFDDHHFKDDLQYEDAVPMIGRLKKQADEAGVTFGVKLTNTFPVEVTQKELPGAEMYLSGRALFPLTVAVAQKLTGAFDGQLRVSFSGGADIWNVVQIYAAGLWPITLATTLLKAGGYNRLRQLAEELYRCPYRAWNGVSRGAVDRLREKAMQSAGYRKSVKPTPRRKLVKKVPLTDCFIAPCGEGCPIHQDVPAYVGLAGEGRYLAALEIILDKNPLPFITGTICNHRCMDKCTRNFYEEPVRIRDTKLLVASKAFDELIKKLQPPQKDGGRIAVIGGGAAGMATAFFAARNGYDVTLFEKKEALGGIVRHVVPAFRVPDAVVEKDVMLLRKMGVDIRMGKEAPAFEVLKKQKFRYVVLAVGAYKPGGVALKTGQAVNVMDFLTKFRADIPQELGKNVVVIGGGNTAMDAARAAKRADGVECVTVVYRRTKRYMPADEEELQLALGDDVRFMELLAPEAHENGMLRCRVMRLGAPDESGRRSSVETDEYRDIPANTVIAAVGERVDDALLRAYGIQTDSRGRAVVDDMLMTNVRGVYVAGDANRGPATVVEAIADARRIADAVCRMEEHDNYTWNDGKAREKKGILMRMDQAACEEQRCLECDVACEGCVDVCPNRANASVWVEGKAQIVHIDKLCNECGNCATFCPYDSAPYKDKFTLFATEKEFDDSKNEGFLVRADGLFYVRLDGDTFETDGVDLPEELELLMRTVVEEYAYLI